MSNDKALATIPRSFGEVQTMADVLAKSTLLPEALRNKAQDVVVQILTGQELGLSPMASIRGIHIIQGKPVLAADTMMGLVLGSGLAEYFVQIESSHTSVTFETKRKGSPHPQRCTWTLDDAKKAGVHTKDNWRLHTRQMLAARAKAELARSAYPDILAACYDPDEIAIPARPVESPKHPDAIDAEIVEPPTAAMVDQLHAIDQAGTPDELRAMVPELAKLKGSALEDGRRRYNDRMAKLTTNGATAP